MTAEQAQTTRAQFLSSVLFAGQAQEGQEVDPLDQAYADLNDAQRRIELLVGERAAANFLKNRK